MMFGPVVSIIHSNWTPIDAELFESFRSQWKRMSIALARFDCTLLLMTPSAVECRSGWVWPAGDVLVVEG